MINVKNRVLGGVLLISGTTIGAAMLALPVVTGLAGLLPTLCLFFLYWIYMTFTAFLLLEVNLWVGENTNLITMAKHTLGKAGEVVSWLTYLFLLYSLTTAYLAGGGPVIANLIYSLSGIPTPSWVGAIPLLLIFGFFVYEGTKYVDYVNRMLILGLAIAYGLMTVFLAPHIDQSYLHHVSWRHSLVGVSLVATSFGYHIIIPTLTTYLHRDVRKLTKTILIGSIVPLAVYVVWEIMTLGVIPVGGESGFMKGYEQGSDITKLLTGTLGSAWVALIIQVFSFLAIVTSFLGVTLSLSDFLADGLHIKKTHMGRFLLFVLTFLPPFVCILTYPRIFLSALEFAGAFGVVILLGMIPCLMVWSGRYVKKLPSTFTVPGGRVALVAAMVFSVLIISVEIANKLGLIENFLHGS